jgi:hypothetical protein
MTRSRASAKKAGTSWESEIVQLLQASGWTGAERRARNGAQDRGDITGLPGVVVEAKNASRVELAEWLKEAQTETANAGAEVGVVWAKRKGKASAADAFVLMDGSTFVRLLKLAGW